MISYTNSLFTGVDIVSKREKIFLLSSIFLAIITVFCTFFLHDIPLRDVAHRYAPMAEAFAAGDIQHAFHLRVPVLHTVTSGIAAFITNCDGFTASKLSSAFWYFIGMFILYKLVRLLVPDDRRMALWSLVLYAVFPCAVQMASSGLRESAKTAFLLLSALSLVRIYSDSRNIANYILLGIACGLGLLIKVDTVITSLIVLALAAFIESRDRKFPLMTAVSGAIAMLLSLPSVLINFSIFKIAAWDWKFAAPFFRYFNRFPDMSDFFVFCLTIGLLFIVSGWILKKISQKISVRHLFFTAVAALAVSVIFCSLYFGATCRETAEFALAFAKGFYSFAGLFILLCITVKIRNQKMSETEYIVLTLCVVNAAANTLPVLLFENRLWVSERYLLSAMPLLFGFFICGINDLENFIGRYIGRKRSFAVLIISVSAIGAAMLFHTFQPFIRDRFKTKHIVQRKNILHLKELLKTNHTSLPRVPQIKKDPAVYHSNRAPKVYFTSDNKISVAAYLAGGSRTCDITDADYIISDEINAAVPENLHISNIGNIQGYRKTFHVWRVDK